LFLCEHLFVCTYMFVSVVNTEFFVD